jgi:outer membrane protein assembly factor BamB
MSKRLLSALIFVSILLLAGCDNTSQGQAPGTVLTTPPGPAPLSVYIIPSPAGASAQAQSTISAIDATTGKLRWHTTVNGQTQSFPRLAQNVVYIGASDGYVSALNASDGKLRWRSRLIVGISPLIERVDNGVVYVVLPTDSSAPYNGGSVLALNASNGSLKWRSSVQGIVEGVTPDALYVASGQTFYALNPASGKILWQFNTEIPIELAEVINGQVYVFAATLADPTSSNASLSGVVYTLNPSTGSLTWRYPAPNVQEPINFAGIHNGVLYLTDSDKPGVSTPDELLALITSDGSLKWRYQQSRLNNNGFDVPVQNGTVYVGGDDGSLYALSEQDGSLRWQRKPESDAFSIRMGDDEGIYVSSSNGSSILALSSTDGSTRWQYGEGSSARILQIGNGVLYGVASAAFNSLQQHFSIFALKASDGSALWKYDAGTAAVSAQVG